GFVNLHLHADKALLGEVMRPNVSGTLPEAIEITNDFKRAYDPEEVARRAGRVLEAGVQHGTTFFRLFADVGTIGGLRAAQGLLLARERFRDLCFTLARRHDRDIHMLVDDTDDPNSRSLEYLARQTMRHGFHGRVTAS